MPRYESYGTYFQANGIIVGAAEDAIIQGLSNWLTDAKTQIITNSLDSEFAQKGFKAFRFLVKKSILGEAVSNTAQEVQLRIDVNGNLSVGFGASFAEIGTNVVTSIIGEAMVTAAIYGIARLLGIAVGGVLVPIAIAVGAGLIWTAIYGFGSDIFQIITSTQDINLQLFNPSGQHIASLIYEKGDDYPGNPDAAVRSLIANINHIPASGTHVEFSGGSDSGTIYNLGTELYNRIAGQLGISFSTLLSAVSEETYNNKYSADNANGNAVYFYPTNDEFEFLIPVVINGVTQNILVNNVYDKTISDGNILAGDEYHSASGVNLILGDNDGGVVAGYNGIDLLLGGMGSDSMLGFYGNDILIGGGGDDTLEGGYGNDIIDGGSEMFGNEAVAGFTELKKYDLNGDRAK